MSARALVVYSVDDPNGGTTYPTKDEALRDARERVRLYRVEQNDNATQVSVTKVTIPGPFNRELVCKLLSHGAGVVAQVPIPLREEVSRECRSRLISGGR